MSSTEADSTSDGKLTTRARIIHAAVRRFAADGLGAPLRAVATDAGVSPGLIIHHFGSGEGLREACDRHVLEATARSKESVLSPGAGAAAMLSQLAQIEEYAPVIGYVLRRLQTGGPLTRRLVDAFAADAVDYLRRGEKAGTVRPSRDREARARVLTEQALGALLLQLPAQQEHLDLDELPRWLDDYAERIIGPVLEYYTEPILTDPTLLDAYLAARPRSNQETP
ncbi:TetR/AcrR family transcriptional regulator [Corynebacterium halotolerans]|uniref:Transcriptional regulator, tetR family protein n=1 Tax=Corynebacterium halotolerans YIM 70093 = DSM 44683 TaxID=1121362 RepID=M1NTE3_9CORY|nr:TetR family transcriptional regulator [Corynebacterium halotolerans]AGF72747.1 transcriptional regulator, tetR family protein [Corynebacterium halotolerans YIM 70093 = DSM 44683]